LGREDLIALGASTNFDGARWIQVDCPFDSGSGHSGQLMGFFLSAASESIQRVGGLNLGREDLIGMGASADCCTLTVKKFKWIARSIRIRSLPPSIGQLFKSAGLESIQ
jgi:hypothetical protein